jgi:hypothetical protein
MAKGVAKEMITAHIPFRRRVRPVSRPHGHRNAAKCTLTGGHLGVDPTKGEKPSKSSCCGFQSWSTA